jgi:hypothetical protein
MKRRIEAHSKSKLLVTKDLAGTLYNMILGAEEI